MPCFQASFLNSSDADNVLLVFEFSSAVTVILVRESYNGADGHIVYVALRKVKVSFADEHQAAQSIGSSLDCPRDSASWQSMSWKACGK